MATKKDKKLNRAFAELEALYAKIPSTKGCMEHINKPKSEGGCGGWCCQHQNPHVLYVEFLYTWRNVLNNWDWDDVINLIERAIRNYLTEKPTKGCVFFDKNTKLCGQHESRPYNCRVYGITPDEEMKPRIERLKVLYKNRIDAVIKDQCNLVSTEDGSTVTTRHTAAWWNKAVEIEKAAGIRKKDVHDGSGGSYMTYHDHILLHVCPDVVMKQLQILRMHGKPDEKETAIKGIMAGFRNKVQKIVEGTNDEQEEVETGTSETTETTNSDDISSEGNAVPNVEPDDGSAIGTAGSSEPVKDRIDAVDEQAERKPEDPQTT